jgi:DNA polymerase-3 subunit epsilon
MIVLSAGSQAREIVMREIVLDTETTGIDVRKGDRVIEIGCVELIHRIPTGREFHRFIDPEDRDVHPEAEAVHGISTAFLKDKPKFRDRDVADRFLDFIGDDPLVIHNAAFDIGFLNMELERLGRKPLEMPRVVDTLALARRKHPAGPNTLDGLCKRYGVDTSNRTKHGAIVDSLLLASVYVELLGERQAALGLTTGTQAQDAGPRGRAGPARQRPSPLPSPLTEADLEAHAAFVESLGKDAIWHRYATKSAAS